MERLEKLINILKLTPHRQPELVKEASHRILARAIRSDPQISYLLKLLIEILIQYCDDDDSAQRSLFNDFLNSVVLTFQHQHFKLILRTLCDEVAKNGSSRALTAALSRIPHLVRNVSPIDLGNDIQIDLLLKSLIVVSKRVEDESVLRSLDSMLKYAMPYLDYHVKRSKETQSLMDLLIDGLLNNLQNESTQITRIVASTIANIYHCSKHQRNHVLPKLESLLDDLSRDDENTSKKFVGFCLCVKDIQDLSERHCEQIISVALSQIEKNFLDVTIVNASLETLRELYKLTADIELTHRGTRLIADKFLFVEVDGHMVIRQDMKVILQANALACISSIIQRSPIVFDQLKHISMFKDHPDVAVRNQQILIIGRYIEASWRYPHCVDRSVDCVRIHHLWVELRSIIHGEGTHPDTLKTCVVAMKTCINTILESDHCLHIVEYQDFDKLIQLYLAANSKPFKIEVLNFFASLNYRTLYYLEKIHWCNMLAKVSGSMTGSIQDRVVNEIMIESLVNEHQRIRIAASKALIAILPNLYVTNASNDSKTMFQRNTDPIVSLADDLASEHLVVLDQTLDHNDQPYDSMRIIDRHKFLSSAIIQSYDNPYSVQKSQHVSSINVNLMYVVNLLKSSIENSLEKGKTAISSIVGTFHELSLVYPVYQYSTSWDCRPSEYCYCYILLNFLLTYLENLNEPDVVVEDLEAYKNFLALSHQILYALCYESVLCDYEHQRLKPYHKRQASFIDGHWSDLSLKHPYIADILQVYFTHLTNVLCLISHIIEERNNPLLSTKQSHAQQSKVMATDTSLPHESLTSNRLLFNRIHRKLESSYKSSKKSLIQREERFYQILETCLGGMSSLLEFIGMSKAMEHFKEIIGHLRVTSTANSVASLVCARQLLKCIFGINILAIYQVDPIDWFAEDPSTSLSLDMVSPTTTNTKLQGVYDNLITNPYKAISRAFSQISPSSDRALADLNLENRRALKVRKRIEDRIKSLFDIDPNQLVTVRIRQLSEILRGAITEFSPIVTECMNNFTSRGFHQYQSETLHLMSYLILLRVNYQKLPLAKDFVNSIYQLLDQCGEKMFSARDHNIQVFLRNSFTFLLLLTYDRPSKAMLQVATVIQKLDDIRAKLSMTIATDGDVATYIVPLLRCLVEDLFIYRTKQFQDSFKTSITPSIKDFGDTISVDFSGKKEIVDELLEAERETVAQKLLDVIDNPDVYDLLSILILESRQSTNGVKYKTLSRHLLSIIPDMLSQRNLDLLDYRRIELTRRIIENISPEVFQPVDFIMGTLFETPKPSSDRPTLGRKEFERWMSLVIISVHILTTQVREEEFLSRLRESMSEEAFIEYLLHIGQLCLSEILIQLSQPHPRQQSGVDLLIQQLSCYILYLTYMFQSGKFFLLVRVATEFIKKEIHNNTMGPANFDQLCEWARDPSNGFCLNACEKMFFNTRLSYPNLTIFWSNVLMLLDYVDCNRDFWRDLIVYECHNCRVADGLAKSLKALAVENSNEADTKICATSDEVRNDCNFKRGNHVNRPSSLNLSDINFRDQLRRSFIKKIAAVDTGDKSLNRNAMKTNSNDSRLLESDTFVGNAEQCLSPNIELTRRGVLCTVLDFVTIGMNDVEHITWLIIHHINDIIRWSHEVPISEFINAVHGYSASSGIFIRAIDSRFTNLTSISLVTRLLSTLEQVHYTQYGSLVVLLVEKFLSSDELMPYRFLTTKIEEFACSTVVKLLNETNKSLVTTSDEVTYQLTTDDLNKIMPMLDSDLYPKLKRQLTELRAMTQGQAETPSIEIHTADMSSDEDSEKAGPIVSPAEKDDTADISDIISAIKTLNVMLGYTGMLQDSGRKANLLCSCQMIARATKLLLKTNEIDIDDPLSLQGFEDRVVELTKAIGTNLSALRKKTQSAFESLNSDRVGNKPVLPQSPKSFVKECNHSGFSHFLRIPAQKLRMTSILNVEINMQETVVIESEQSSNQRDDDMNAEACLRLLLSIYKQKIKEPSENLGTSPEPNQPTSRQSKNRPSQLAPPLYTAMSQSILALSDMFTDYEQFDWLFETFVQMFRLAERNEDEIQMQYLILGLCKAATICCYEIPTEITTVSATNHRDVMFEKCRQSIEKCVKSEFVPLKLNALFGAFYMLEDSINIVASGAWELDHFKRLRQSRLTWILKLMPILLDKANSRLLTKKAQIMQLLDALCETVTLSEVKAIKL